MYYFKPIFFVLLFLGLLFAQQSTSIITGNFNPSDENKFIYLYTPGVDHAPEELIVEPIVNHQVQIKKSFDKKGRLLSWGLIFLGYDDKITMADFKEMRKDYDFVRDRKLLIVLEDSVTITFSEPVSFSKVNGGHLNKEWQHLFEAIKENQHVRFVKEHPDSPFSLTCLKALRKVSLYTDQLNDVDISSLYNDLSDRIKQSIEGKEFFKQNL